MNTTYLQEKMTGNLRDQQVAFQAAESVIHDAEQFIDNIATTGSFDGSNGLLGQTDAEPDYLDDATWSTTNSIAYSATLPEVSDTPRYIIKHIGEIESPSPSLGMPKYGTRKIGDTSLFRITVRGSGSTPAARVIIQSHYGKVL